MASVSTLSFLKLRLYAKSRFFKVKFHYGHKISFLKSRLYFKSRFVKSRLYCSFFILIDSPCRIEAIPSISRLQRLIEAAWSSGFDPQGRDQLGGRLSDTRKWIGATEIAAFLTSIRIRTEVVDFHRPSANDGTHPLLFQWVENYFRRRNSAPHLPLYFQHQGHSRTIIGFEPGKAKNRLLVLDPSFQNMKQISDIRDEKGVNKVMKSLRKTPSMLKEDKFQIVAVTGIFSTQAEADLHKIIRGKPIP